MKTIVQLKISRIGPKLLGQLIFIPVIGTTMTTELGHLDQERKNLKSTTTDHKHEIIEPNESLAGTNANLITPTLHEEPYKQKYKIYSNQTGRFPYVSSRGNQYILVMYDQDYNAIVVEPLKRRHGTQLAVAFKQCCDKLKLKEQQKHLFILDKECPKKIQSTINSLGGTYQLVPPHQYRRNTAAMQLKQQYRHSRIIC